MCITCSNCCLSLHMQFEKVYILFCFLSLAYLYRSWLYMFVFCFCFLIIWKGLMSLRFIIDFPDWKKIKNWCKCQIFWSAPGTGWVICHTKQNYETCYNDSFCNLWCLIFTVCSHCLHVTEKNLHYIVVGDASFITHFCFLSFFYSR